MTSVIFHPPRHPADMAYREGIVKQLQLLLKDRVDQAYIFGSFTTEGFHGDSDLDLILICRTEEPFVERGRSFFDLFDLGIAIDLLVYTPEEWEQIQREKPVGFWKSAFATLRQIL